MARRSQRVGPSAIWDPSVCRDYGKAELAVLMDEARSRVARVRRSDLDADLFLHGVHHGWWDPDGRLPEVWSDTYRSARAALSREVAPLRPAVRDAPRRGPRQRVQRWWRRRADRWAARRRDRAGR